MAKIKEGQKAPAFTAEDQNGKKISLAKLKGKIVVLYFYPKDSTPGCTIEACSFRDAHDSIKKAGALVLGVSVDDKKSHQKFIKSHDLPFPLLADTNKTIVQSYGVWGEKSFMGRTYLGTNRVTVIIDKNGIVKKIFEKVKPLGHAQEVLAVIKAIT